MRTLQFSSEDLRSFFFDHTIGTMEQLKDVLGTSVDMTIYRKLRQLSYLTSYSHHGKYYTLEELTDSTHLFMAVRCCPLLQIWDLVKDCPDAY